MSGILGMLLGSAASPFYVRLETHSVNDSNPAPGTSRATIKVDADGVLYTRLGSGAYNPDANEWLIPPDDAEADNYTVELVTDTGTLSGGNADTEEALSSDREYYVERLTEGSKAFTGTLVIRRGGVLHASASIGLTATVTGA